MTAVWDIIQTFLTKIGELKDPDYYKDTLQYMKALVDDIHSIDHSQGQRISKSISRECSFKDIEEFMRKVK